MLPWSTGGPVLDLIKLAKKSLLAGAFHQPSLPVLNTQYSGALMIFLKYSAATPILELLIAALTGSGPV